uniref:Uncharacterized protein n=1 Tax=Globodera rostochiensis TaxID=31243 RepID=A0A914HEA1_GLORO
MQKVFAFVKHPLVFVPVGSGATYYLYNCAKEVQTGHEYVIGDQSGKTYIVTGATSGIGKQVATELAMKNAEVVMACRNRNKCLEVRRDIVLNTRNKKVFCRMCDLSDMESVHQFVQKMTKGKYDFKKIDGVILNAATKCKKYMTNKDGVETTLATNHLGSFLLVGLLLQKLLEQEGQSRVIFVGTDITAKNTMKLELDKLNSAKYKNKRANEKLDMEKGKYDIHAAYKYSKLMQLVFARELAERLEGNNKVRVVVADPGGTKSNLNKDEGWYKFFFTRWCANGFGYLIGNRRAVRHAVYPILFAIEDDAVKNGTFVSSRRRFIDWGENAENADLRKLVWAMSERWTKLEKHMDQMEKELEKPNYFAATVESDSVVKSQEKPPRSARYLWLA